MLRFWVDPAKDGDDVLSAEAEGVDDRVACDDAFGLVADNVQVDGGVWGIVDCGRDDPVAQRSPGPALRRGSSRQTPPCCQRG